MMTPEQAVLASILICAAGAIVTLLVSRYRTLAGWLSFLVTAATGVLILSAVAQVLTVGPSDHPTTFGWTTPEIGFGLRIHVDGLTAMFLMLAALIALPAAFYSIATCGITRSTAWPAIIPISCFFWRRCTAC